jgi:O-antigen ligase
MTSISSFLFLVMIGTLLSVDKIFKPIGMKKTFSTITIVLACILFLSVIFLNSNLIASVANLAGKDLTFTGRTFLWASMLQEISNHILLGTGFQAFWSLSNPSVRILYETFNWLPNQSHNGYIDIMNEVGLVGFILFISMIVNYFLNNIKLIRPNPWKWLIIIALIINLQESSFFRAGHLVGGMLVFAYLILFQQLRNEEEYEGDNEKIEGKPKSENELIHSNH